MRVIMLSYPEVRPANATLLREAAASMGVSLEEVLPHELWLRLEGGGVSVMYRDRVLDPDAVIHRTIYPLRDLIVPALELLSERGVIVLNEPAAALRSRSKLATLVTLSAQGLPVVTTHAFAATPSALWDPPSSSAGVVCKPSLGKAGHDVVALSAPATRTHLEAQRYDERVGPTLVQPRLPAPYDLRAYVVGGRCVALARRRAAAGEFRCNVALGASVEVVEEPLASRAAALAEEAAVALGLDLAGVDLLHDETADQLLCSEVDAWAGFAGLQRGLGVPVATHVLELALARGAQGAPS